MKSIFVVSDLHMFCRRSHWEDSLPEIHKAARSADLFVFNGDTVDFKWSSLGSVEATVEAAMAIFEELAEAHPKCQFHVNLGNHDHLHAFMDALEQYANKASNFSWHPYYLRVGNKLFLHGDVAMRKMSHRQLEHYRSNWQHHKEQHPWKHHAYDAAFRAKAHIAVSRVAFPRRLTLRRVSAYLEDIGHGAKDGIKHVYFGHTHVPVNGCHYKGVTFHNGGAPMPGINFRVLKAHA